MVGYELLFRDSPTSAAAAVPGAEAATTGVILNAFTELGLEQAAGSAFAWINVSREFLLGGFARTLPAARVGLEILEGQHVDAELVDAVAQLRGEGYRFALDDFVLGDESERLLPHAEVVKLDLVALGRDELADHVRRLRPLGVTLLAEKVESAEEHAFASQLGCERFQGFFYCRPELLSGRRIAAGEVSLLRLLAELQRPDLELEQVADLVSQDVGLGIRLLRYLNSAYLGLGHEIASLAQAVTLLGLNGLRRWATLSAFAGLAGGRSELARTALVRARFCELAGRAGEPSQRFTLGLFSVIDAVTHTPMEEALAAMPFPVEMRTALIDHSGPLGQLLGAALALESGNFDLAQRCSPDCPDAYLEALRWADETAGPFLGAAPLTAA